MAFSSLSRRSSLNPGEIRLRSNKSPPGRYEGTAPVYSEYVRTITYVPVRDGHGWHRHLPAERRRKSPFPSAAGDLDFTLSRAFRLPDGSPCPNAADALGETVLKHGYVIAAADLRGGGEAHSASHRGIRPGRGGRRLRHLEWLAAQPWSTERSARRHFPEGMTRAHGREHGAPPPAAIMPDMVMFDLIPSPIRAGFSRTTSSPNGAGVAYGYRRAGRAGGRRPEGKLLAQPKSIKRMSTL
jgi:hypothetical protein